MDSLFCVRIVSADSHLVQPTPNMDPTFSDFKQKQVKSVPVIRIFGSTPSGQRACINIHGVFPYLMVPYKGPHWKESEQYTVHQYLFQLASSLDFALNTSLGSKFKSDHVYKITLVRVKPFYGYYVKEEVFMKIYFYSPSDIKRAADLLQAGAVMNSSFQPHEAHIPYILQMFLDYNLYGMNLLHTSCCWFRKPIGKDDVFRVVPKITKKDEVNSNNKGTVNIGASTSGSAAGTSIETVADLSKFDWKKVSHNNSSHASGDASCSETSSCQSDRPAVTKASCDVECTPACLTSLRRSLSNSKANEFFNNSVTVDNHKCCPLHTRWRTDNVPLDAYLPVDIAPKQTSCEIEVDILAADILNRKELEQSSGRNPGIISIWEDEKARRRARSDSSLIDLPSSGGHRQDEATKKEEDTLKFLKQSISQHFPSSMPGHDNAEAGPSRRASDQIRSSFCSDSHVVFDPSVAALTRSNSSESGSRSSNLFPSRRVSIDETSLTPDSLLNDLIEMDENAKAAKEASHSSQPNAQRRVSFEPSPPSTDSFFVGMDAAANVAPIVNELIVTQLASPDDPWPRDTMVPDELDERSANTSSIASQHSNGMVDDVLSDDDDDVTLIDTSNKSRHNSSDLIESNESLIMSQPWESGIEDLLLHYHSDQSDDDTVIPQLDGKSDDDVIESSQLIDTSHRSVKLKKRKGSVLPSTYPRQITRMHEAQKSPSSQQISKNTQPSRKSLKIQKQSRKTEESTLQRNAPQIMSSTPKTLPLSDASFAHVTGAVTLRAQPMPPSWQDAQAFLQDTHTCWEESTEPFYSNPLDVQPVTSSRLLTTLPSGSEGVMTSSKQIVDEFKSNFPCGLQHWKFVASTIVPNPSISTNNQPNTSSYIIPDVKEGVLVIKPLYRPPSPARVWKWAKLKREKKSQQKSGITEIIRPAQAMNSDEHLLKNKPYNYDRSDISALHDIADTFTPVVKSTTEKIPNTANGSKYCNENDMRDRLTSTPLSSLSTKKKPISSSHKKLFDDSNSVMKFDLPQPSVENQSCPVSSSHTSPADSLSLRSFTDNDSLAASNVVGVVHNTFAFRASQRDLADAKVLHEKQHLIIMSMELHVKTRLALLPDPEIDEIRALFYSVQTDSSEALETGCYIIDDVSKGSASVKRCGISDLKTTYIATETDLFNHLSTLIINIDPDILLGYEVQMQSWGYLLSRAAHLGYDLCRYLSRVPDDVRNSWCSSEKDEFGADNASEIHIVGRLVLNLWRLMRSEVALYDYKFESVAYHLLHQRHPHYSPRTLTLWFDQPQSLLTTRYHQSHTRARVIKYMMSRVLGNLRLISQQDIIGRTSELARLFGIQFYEVLTRGSQYRVESMMLRQAHSLNYVAVSPSSLQRASQKAPECIALVMEPESRFYSEPVIVVDFQSLYPSVIIAYNYCYSTCLGRTEHLKTLGSTPFGCTTLDVPQGTVKQLLREGNVHIAPNSVGYVKSNVRRGVLPAMLEEILNTRIMVKDSMKKCKDKATKKMLDHRQLGLKLIANVTYGYTGASFSGRMACVEIADSIVNKARETLERAIELVHAHRDKWHCRVVYGDTDSMFIALEKGTSKKRAFQVGREIVEAVTKSNPRPVKLKFEKVYQPCVLQTKKRYVGYAYESEEQEEPIFDAKGIETVRRDGCPAVAKILEKSLRILFDSRDVSKVKEYVTSECGKIVNDGKATLQDCIIAKEYRGAKFYKPGVLVPALVLTRKLLAMDKRSEPRIGERVPYVVVHGAPGTPLYQLIRQPKDVINDVNLKLNGTYYVTKMVLPALSRMMSLLGVDVFQWYYQLPREIRLSGWFEDPSDEEGVGRNRRATLSQYFSSRHCLSCKSLCTNAICSHCLRNPLARQECAVTLHSELVHTDTRYAHINQICASCTDTASHNDIKCESLDCPVLYKRIRAEQDSARAKNLRAILKSFELF